MKAAQPASAPELKLVVYPRGPHTFDMRLPDRTILGMRLGYDAEADADARRQVIDFLEDHGKFQNYLSTFRIICHATMISPLQSRKSSQ